MPYIVGGAGLATSAIGGKAGANASQNIAEAAASEATAERQFNIQAATATPFELQALQQQATAYGQTANLQQAQLQQQMQLYGSINPQVMSLLQGGMAPTLQPYLNVQQMQKTQLQSDLARQLGPGWENTTAGQQALQNFNLQGSNQAAQIQQQYLGTMMANQLALGASNTGAINQNAQTLNSLSMGMIGGGTDLQKLMLQASQGSNVAGYMGAGNIGQQMMGGMFQGLGSAALGVGGSMLTAQTLGNAFGNALNNYNEVGGGALAGASPGGMSSNFGYYNSGPSSWMNGGAPTG